MEKEEIEAAKTPEIDRTAALGNRAQTRTADERSILALQRSAGNRAVGTLLARAPRARGVGPVAPFELPLQRAPDGPGEEERVWPVAWPEETEGERNEPCFDPDSQVKIALGVAWADGAAADLTAMPPDLKFAVGHLQWTLDAWEGTFGADPGQTRLNEAKGTIRRAAVRVMPYAEKVSAMLNKLLTAALNASGDASTASTMMTKPASEEEESRPCFEEGQQAVIAEGVALADAAATELGQRPPDYRKALATLRNAANKLGALGGEEPGQAKLAGAVAVLDQVIGAVDAYLTPVETVVAEAAAGAKAASAQAREAADMAKPGPHAASEGAEPPEAGGQAPDLGQGPES